MGRKGSVSDAVMSFITKGVSPPRNDFESVCSEAGYLLDNMGLGLVGGV